MHLTRITAAIISAVIWVFAFACSVDPDNESVDVATTPWPVVSEDTSGCRSCDWEGGAEDTESDSSQLLISRVEDTDYKVGVDGFVRVVTFASDDGFLTSATAEFFQVNGPPTRSEEVIAHVLSTGIDTCELLEETGMGATTIGGGDPVTWLDAGDVFLHDGVNLIPLVPRASASNSDSFTYEDGGLDGVVDGWCGRTLRLTATGGEFPAIADGEVVLEMPSARVLESPAPGAVWSAGGVDVAWSGADGESTAILLARASRTEGIQRTDVFDLRCEVLDDGEFHIPGDVLGIMPAGVSLLFYLRVENSFAKQLASGMTVNVTGIVQSARTAVLSD